MDKSIDINVRPNPDPAGKDRYIFSMDEGKGATDELVFNKTSDGMKKTENYRLKFKLKNQDGAALRFSKDRAKVLWAKPVNSKTDPCPDSDCYMNGIFYADPNSAIKDHELTVINTDPTVQMFKFAFNFLPPGESDPPASGYVWYDPIGDNQNGGLSVSWGGGTTAMTIGGAIVGAVGSLLVNEAARTQDLLMWTISGAAIGFALSFLVGRGREESRPSGPPA